MNLYGFVGNNPVKYSDVLGLEAATVTVPAGYLGTFNSRDQAGYYGSRSAFLLQQRGNNEREYCGIICCRSGIILISRPHAGPERPWTSKQDGVKNYNGTPAKCNTRMDGPKEVKCPDDTWSLIGDYHSHLDIPGQNQFSPEDFDTVNGSNDLKDPRKNTKGSQLPLYVGTPDGKVRRLDPEEDSNKPGRGNPHEGVIIPDSWNYETRPKENKR